MPSAWPEAKRSGGRGIKLEIAGLVFRVLGADGPARAWLSERYRPFLSDKPARLTLGVTFQRSWPRGRPPRPRVELDHGTFQITMAACRARGNLTSGRVHVSVPPVPAALNPSLFRALCSLLLLREGGVLLHASAVVQQGRAWLFCGPSESGKTTIARLAGERLVLNDETVAVRAQGDGYEACATPFFGEGGPAMALTNTRAPLRAVFFLNKADGFAHRRLTAREAIQRAWAQVFLPKRDGPVVDGILANLIALTTRVDCFDLFFAPHAGLWEYLDGI